MAVVNLLAKAAAKYFAKGWGKHQVAHKLVSLKQFANNKQSILKLDKRSGDYTYSTPFNDAWKSIGGKKITKEEAIATARKGRHTLKTEEEKAAINKKLREARLKNIAEGKGMNLPPPPKLRGSKRLYVPQLDAFIKPYTQDRGVHEVMEQALRRDKQRGLLDIAFGKGTKAQKDKRQIQFLKQFQKNLRDDEFMGDYLRAATPYGKKAQRFFDDPKKFRALSTNKQYVEVVRNYLKSRGYSDKEITDLFPTRFATTGHIPPVRESYADWLGFGNKASLKAFEQSADPKMWNPELGLVNIAKGTSDPWIFKAAQKNRLSPKGLEQATRMYDAFGIQSLIRGKSIGKGFDLERQAKLIDWATATPYETKLFTGRPGTKDVDKARNMFKRMLEKGDITYEEIFAAIHKGKYPGFKRGGLVSLGSRILRKLAKKLSRQEMKMMMGN